MRIWLVTIGEPVPLEGQFDRLHRTGQFAAFLAETGHEVVWWTSSFDHFRKRHIAPGDVAIQTSHGFTIQLLHGCGYKKNVSLRRIADQRIIASRFSKAALGCSRPDVLVAALPVVELCNAAVDYGDRMHIPVLLDMRDMWPDIFVELAPAWARPIARTVLLPQFRQARIACSRATAITGITEAFVEWGLARGGRRRSFLDRAFPLAYAGQVIEQEQRTAAERFWEAALASRREYDLCACFVGSIGHSLDTETLIDAAALIHARHQERVQFVICGTGDHLERLRRKAANLPNVVFPGWVDAPRFEALKGRAQVGLNPLPDRFDFLATINNKAIEYLSAGLPVVSSPDSGTVAELLERNVCGLTYPSGAADRLALILCQLSRDRDLLNRMSASARRTFCAQFEAGVVHRQMLSHLEETTSWFREQSQKVHGGAWPFAETH